MIRIIVDCARQHLTAFDTTGDCTIGRSGPCRAQDKTEGDGATPVGVWPMRCILVRPDRVLDHRIPVQGLPWRFLRPDDGWSDDPRDPAYNRPVRHPHAFSAERLWRTDDAYDMIIVIGYNDAPPRPGKGSAIFLHCTPQNPFTQGCIAIPKTRLLQLAPLLRPGDQIAIG